jgi:hypothetical protein
MIAASNLFRENQPPDLKISRVAVVLQDNCHGHIILNLSAEVTNPKYVNNWKAPRPKCSPDPEPGKATKSTRHNPPLQSSVNNTTEPAKDQSGIKALGPALPSILKFMFNTDCTWEIERFLAHDHFHRGGAQLCIPNAHQGHQHRHVLRGPIVPTNGVEK